MGRTKVRKTSFSNYPKITASLTSDANPKMGTYQIRMDTERPKHSLRMNGYYGNTSNVAWNNCVGLPSQRHQAHTTDPHPLRSHMRYFGQQVFQNDVSTSNTTAYKYSVDFLNNVRQHMYFERNDRNGRERNVGRRTESVQSSHTFANLLRCYGYHNNWLSFKFGYTYQKELLYRRKTEIWNQDVREPDVVQRDKRQKQNLDILPLPEQHSLQREQIEQKNVYPPSESNDSIQDYEQPFIAPVNEKEETLNAGSSSSNRALSPRYNEFVLSPPKAMDALPTEDRLSKGIWQMFHANKQSEATFAKKMCLWQELYNCFQQMASWLPKYELYLMGSTISGFGTDNSDIDMCIVDIDGPTYCDSRTEALNNLLRVKSFIESMSTSSSFEHLDLIRAKVPILRFRHVRENLDIDLSINNRVGIRNTHLLHCYAQLDPRVRPLVMIIKLWAQHHNLNDPINSTMSSYSIVLMVINFLQCGVTPAVVPCLHKLYPEKFCKDNYNSNLLERIDPHHSDNKNSLGELLCQFYKYYAEFE
uniref:Poly(A) RNA polymerase mitochondrial-like central palm domain-containing protein n=1 Tax=Anopheles funestus TaxID=62324 RepID=A0A182RJ62_ANOFN